MSKTAMHLENKKRIVELVHSQYDFEANTVKSKLQSIFAAEAKIQLCFPFEMLPDVDTFFDTALLSLHKAMPDLERRDTIIMSGETTHENSWVGCCGYFIGSFMSDWLNIPATRRTASMRFHEFYRFENNKVVEMQAIWDIPELMIQANAWPLVPSLGREWHVPGPATQDGINLEQQDPEQTKMATQIVTDMCVALGNYATDGVEAMNLPQYWHAKCSWYGPSGIGTSRTLKGFRQNHQIPFLNGLPDRTSDIDNGHMFGDNNYVGFTAWPGMYMTVSGSGWLGIAPGNQRITMRSLDFWRVENGLIRENWVLVDLLSVYDQLKIDVFARMRELKA